MNKGFKELYELYNQAKSNALLITLDNPTTGNIKKCLIDAVNDNELSEKHKKAIFYFLSDPHKANHLDKLTNLDLIQLILESKLDVYRPISGFFKGKPKKIDKHGGRTILNLILESDLKKTAEPHLKESVVQNQPSEKEDKAFAEKSRDSGKFYITVTGTVVALGLVLFFTYLAINKNDSSTKADTNNYHIENYVVSQKDRIPENQLIDHFSYQDKPELWYISYKGQTEFYSKPGIHKITKRPLKPVSKEIISAYKDQSDANNPKTKIEEGKHRSPVDDNSTVKELAVIIFNNESKLDIEAQNHLKKLLKNDYTFRAIDYLSNGLSAQIVDQIKSFNFNSLDINEGESEFILIGEIDYSFSQSDIQKDMTVCRLSLNYSIISYNNKKEMDSNSISVSGIGFSESNAKQNTIKKITL